ncbi:MAG: hypothetical protein MUF20_13320 [Methylotetracoccus sp.]|jgi:hypothetical protein|nr:hypothetical protein [Methylotetracoccus sp.]
MTLLALGRYDDRRVHAVGGFSGGTVIPDWMLRAVGRVLRTIANRLQRVQRHPGEAC